MHTSYALEASTQLNHTLYYIGVIALVLVGVIIAASAFISIYASIRNSKEELAAQNLTDSTSSDGDSTDSTSVDSNSAGDTDTHDEVDIEEVEEHE